MALPEQVPEPNVYFITVKPMVTGVTTPEVLTVATAVLLLVQVPPEVASVKVAVEPVQTEDAPLIVGTEIPELTVTT